MIKYFFIEKRRLFILLALKSLSIAILLYFNIILRDIINFSIAGSMPYSLQKYIIFLFIYLLLSTTLLLIANLMQTRFYYKISYYIKRDYFNALINMEYSQVLLNDSSAYLSTLSNDVGIIVNSYFNSIMNIITAIITLICSLGYATAISWQVSLMMLGGSILFLLSPLILKKKVDNATFAISEANKNYTNEVKDLIQGLHVIKMFNIENVANIKSDCANKNLYEKSIKSADINIIAGNLVGFIINLLKIIILIITTFAVLSQKLDVGAITGLFALANAFYFPINNIGNNITNIFSTKQVRKKFLQVLFHDNKTSMPIDLSFKNIEIEQMDFAYSNNRLVLKNINLDFKLGKKYLILGESGSGKSTLLKLIAGLYFPCNGRISIGGISYNAQTAFEIRKVIAFAQQDAYLFNDSLRSNIVLNEDYDTARLHNIINICKLNKLVDKLEQGLNTVISEEVNTTSEGEKMRINLARALYKNSSILLLDEITSSLDAVNTYDIEKIVLSLKDKMIINVSHKVTACTIREYDEIIIIENGRVLTVINGKEYHDEQLKKYININDEK